MENDKIKIVSWDASKIIRKSNLCDSQNANISLRDKKGQPIRDEFNGYLDHSLETDKLSEVYDKHRKAFQDKAFSAFYKKHQGFLPQNTVRRRCFAE